MSSKTPQHLGSGIPCSHGGMGPREEGYCEEDKYKSLPLFRSSAQPALLTMVLYCRYRDSFHYLNPSCLQDCFTESTGETFGVPNAVADLRGGARGTR